MALKSNFVSNTYVRGEAVSNVASRRFSRRVCVIPLSWHKGRKYFVKVYKLQNVVIVTVNIIHEFEFFRSGDINCASMLGINFKA